MKTIVDSVNAQLEAILNASSPSWTHPDACDDDGGDRIVYQPDANGQDTEEWLYVSPLRAVTLLTSSVNGEKLKIFLCCYRDFMRPKDLMHFVCRRLLEAFFEDPQCKVRTFVFLRHWLEGYFEEDWSGDNSTVLLMTIKEVQDCLGPACTPMDLQILNKLKALLTEADQSNSIILADRLSIASISSGSAAASLQGSLFKKKSLHHLRKEYCKSVLCRWPVDEIVEHFCTLEHAAWAKLCWLEFIGYPKGDGSFHISDYIERFNRLGRWFVAEIEAESTAKGRGALLDRLVAIAAASVAWGNMSTAMAIVLALQSEPVQQICDEGWDPGDPKVYEGLLALTSPFTNFRNLRWAVERRFERCERGSTVDHQCVPFLGMYLGDLVSLRERNTCCPDGMINWCLYRGIYRIVRQLRTFQRHPYPFQPRDIEISFNN